MPPMTGVLMAIGADMCSIVYSVDRITARTTSVSSYCAMHYHHPLICYTHLLLQLSRVASGGAGVLDQQIIAGPSTTPGG